MAVIVFLGDKEVKAYPQADAASLHRKTFIVTRWNGALRAAETVETFDADTVIMAEVYTPDSPVQVVEGRYLPLSDLFGPGVAGGV